MAHIDIRKNHGTDRADAATRARALFDAFAAKRPELIGSVTWGADGTSGSITGKGFKGNCKVNDHAVVVTIDLSLLARPFKGQIEDNLRKRLEREFSA